MSDAWNIEVPDEELEFTPRTFERPKTGYYNATLEPGAEYASGDTDDGGWEAADIVCTGLVQGSNTKFQNYKVNGRFYSSNTKGVVNLARALNIAVRTDSGWRPAADNMEEFVEQVNSMAGANVRIYVETGPRRKPTGETDSNGKRVWETVLREDGEPFVDSKIRSVEPTS